MTVPVQSQIFNPITGVFGTGQMQVFGAGQGGAWYVPNGIGKVRVRLWGGGAGAASGNAGGGGFALKTIYDLSGVTSIAVYVGAGGSSSGGAGGTSSFGSYVSATGGSTSGTGGTGVGGDINTSGGSVSSQTGGGVGSLFGNGGSLTAIGASGAAYGSSTNTPYYSNGFLGSGGNYIAAASTWAAPTSGMISQFSIDLIGTGGGGNGTSYIPGINGGGSGSGGGGFPGGGCSNGYGAPGMVIVEF